jgi:glycosyltransferase involved in cell wall biosynthesis
LRSVVVLRGAPLNYELVSVVLPVYRQAEQIADLARSFVTAVQKVGFNYEILLVVNGPPDGTLEAARAVASSVPKLRVIATPDAGWGRAVRLGIEEAKGDLLCYTNAARTPDDVLTALVAHAAANPGVVVKATRRRRDNRLRRLGSLLYNLECRALLDLPFFDINGTPKIFPRRFDHLLQLRRNDDLIDAEFMAECRGQGYPVIEVPIALTLRRGGRSTTKLSSALHMYAGAFALRRDMRRRRTRLAPTAS